ncbi:MAG: LysR family transcriptional regulator [Bacilli bacterium]
MELRTLKYFIVVAEELNITKAANILNMSQPPLSYQMKNLEEELGSQLFIRGKRHLKLTDVGKLLYVRAKEIVNLTKKVGEEIVSMTCGIQGTISIGLVEGVANNIGSEWIPNFVNKYPNVKFRILDSNSDDLIEKIENGELTLAVITAPYDQVLLNGFSVGKDSMVALINKDHPLAKKESEYVSLKELESENLIVPTRKSTVYNISKWFRNEKITPNISFEVDNFLDAVALVSRNVGISLFPEPHQNINDSLVVKKLRGQDDYYLDYYFVWKKGRQLPLLEEKFIDFIKDSVKKKA